MKPTRPQSPSTETAPARRTVCASVLDQTIGACGSSFPPAAEGRVMSMPPASSPSRTRRRALFCALALWGLSSPLCFAQEQNPVLAPTQGMDYTLQSQDASASASYWDEPRVAGGYGFKGRIGNEAGSTVGRNQSITYFDLSPYIFQDNLYLFGEGRLGIVPSGQVGGSAGGGFRYYFPQINSIVGFNSFWDGDNTRGVMFNQWGLGGEVLTEWLDIRANYYFPYGNTFQVTGQRFEAGSQQFVDVSSVTGNAADPGTYLQFQRRTFTANAMQGFDVMFSVPVPGDLAQRVNLETSAGFYHFTSTQANVPQVWGWKLRWDADVFERLSHMFLEVMNDQVFKTNVVFGIDINYWNKLEYRPRIGHSQYHRLADWVRRNRTTVAFEGSFLNAPELAINPNTNNPYLIYQVRNDPARPVFPVPTGNGTLEKPYQYIPTAINAAPPADIIFVQGNSVFDGIVDGVANTQVDITRDNLMVVGEQQNPTIGIPVQGLSGNVLFPTITPTPFNAPVIQNLDVTGTGLGAVTLDANDTFFGAINLTNITGGPALLAPGVAGGQVQLVNINTVNGVGVGNGIEMNGNSGLFTFTDINVVDTEGDAFVVNGNTANIVFQGTNVFDNTSNTHAAHGYSVNIQSAGGTINMLNTLVEDNGGTGVLVNNSTANVTFADIDLTNTVVTGGAVLVNNHSGAVNFTGGLTINGAVGDAFVVSNLQQASNVNVLGTTTISNRQGRGIYVQNIDGLGGTNTGSVVFRGTTTVGPLAAGFAGLDPAVQFDSASGLLDFAGDLGINGSNGNGIQIANIVDDGTTNVGRFFSEGAIAIQNVRGTSINVDNINKTGFQVRTSGITVDRRGTGAAAVAGGIGVNVSNYAGTATFLNTTTINNQLNDTDVAIEIFNNSNSISFTHAVVFNARGPYLSPAIPPLATGLPLPAPLPVAGLSETLGAVDVRNNTDTAFGVSFGTLDVQAAGGTGVSLDDNAFVSVGGGTLTITTGRGVEVINNTDHNITFDAINATAADYGIIVYHENSTTNPITSNNNGTVNQGGSFTVRGVNNAVDSGGIISTMTVAGGAFINTQNVDLEYMRFNANNRGLVFNTINRPNVFGDQPVVLLNNDTINASINEGIFGVDVLNFTLQNSTVTNNGATGTQEQIELRVDTSRVDNNNDGVVDTNDAILNYVYTIFNNDIEDPFNATIANTDMIFIHTAAGINDPVPLTLRFNNNGTPPSTTNTVTSNRTAGNAALHVDWQGQFTAGINQNTFSLLNGTGQVGVNLNINGVADVTFDNNNMSGTGTNDIGLQFVFQKQAAVEIANNEVRDAFGNITANSGFLFTGAGSTAMDLTFLTTNNRVFINNNLITFNTTQGGNTGILFRRIFGNNYDTEVNINGNQISLYPNNTFLNFVQERGIYFQDIRGTITLIGNVDNIITPGTNNPFYIDFGPIPFPTGVTRGSILVNGSPVP